MGMSVNAWTVDDKADAQKLSKLGVDWITTNEPVRMGAWLRNEPIYRFISFNIRQSGFPEYDGEHAWPHRKETVVKMIRTEAPDAFGVQEMLPEQRDYLLKHLPEYAMVGVGRDDGHDEGENMAIFYLKKRFRILKERTLWLSETPNSVSFGWDAACRRTVTEALLQDKRTKCVIDYFNTHLDHVGKVARRESVLLLVRQMEEASKEGVPVLLSGPVPGRVSPTPLAHPTDRRGGLLQRLRNREQRLRQQHRSQRHRPLFRQEPVCHTVQNLGWILRGALHFRPLSHRRGVFRSRRKERETSS